MGLDSRTSPVENINRFPGHQVNAVHASLMQIMCSHTSTSFKKEVCLC